MTLAIPLGAGMEERAVALAECCGTVVNSWRGHVFTRSREGEGMGGLNPLPNSAKRSVCTQRCCACVIWHSPGPYKNWLQFSCLVPWFLNQSHLWFKFPLVLLNQQQQCGAQAWFFKNGFWMGSQVWEPLVCHLLLLCLWRDSPSQPWQRDVCMTLKTLSRKSSPITQ